MQREEEDKNTERREDNQREKREGGMLGENYHQNLYAYNCNMYPFIGNH